MAILYQSLCFCISKSWVWGWQVSQDVGFRNPIPSDHRLEPVYTDYQGCGHWDSRLTTIQIQIWVAAHGAMTDPCESRVPDLQAGVYGHVHAHIGLLPAVLGKRPMCGI